MPREVSLGFTDAGADYRRSAVDLAPPGRRRGARRACRPCASSPTTPRPSGAPKSGCRICGPAARAPSSRCRRAALALDAGRRRSRSTLGGRRRAARTARDRRYRAARASSARAIDPEVFALPLAAAAPPRRRRCRRRSGRCMRVLLDLPALPRRRAAGAARACGVRQSVAGPVAIWRSLDDGASYRALAIVRGARDHRRDARRSAAGPTEPLGPGRARAREALWRRARVGVRPARARAAPMPRPCSGRTARGRSCSSPMPMLVGERTYELSRLLRGADSAAKRRSAIRCRRARRSCCSIAHVVPIARGLETLGRRMQLRVVAADRDHGDPSRGRDRGDGRGDSRSSRSRRCICARGARPAACASPGARASAALPASASRRGADSARRAKPTSLNSLRRAVVRTLSATTPSVLYAASDEIARLRQRAIELQRAPLSDVGRRRPRPCLPTATLTP